MQYVTAVGAYRLVYERAEPRKDRGPKLISEHGSHIPSFILFSYYVTLFSDTIIHTIFILCYTVLIYHHSYYFHTMLHCSQIPSFILFSF